MQTEIPSWTYRLVNFPQPPQQFVELALAADPTLYKSRAQHNYYKPGKDPHAVRTMTHQDHVIEMVRIPRYIVGDQFDQWVNNNMVSNFMEATVAISHPGNGGSLGPHTDRVRNFVLIYVMQKGGDRVRTNFFQEHGYSLIRDKFTIVDDYDSLQLVESVDVPLNHWIVLNGRILHSVDQIDSVRIAFQIELQDLSEVERFYV